jgi:hypothetical protein
MSFERTQPPLVPGVNRPPPEPPQLVGYRLLEPEARSLHASAHGDGCWCTGMHGVDFLRELFSRCLQPAGFTARVDKRPGILIEDGPGISDERPAEMYQAVRSCESTDL